MSEVQSGDNETGENKTGAPKRNVLKWAIGAVMLVGVAAILYVIAAASFKPSGPANLNQFKTASLAKLDVPASPRAAPGTTFFDETGKAVTLADFKGQVVVMNLWATWCAPCRAEMPALNALQKEMGSDSFEVVAVNVDTGDDVKPKKFLADTGVDTLAYYREPTLDLFNELKMRGLALGLPVTMLIDGEGCLLAHMNGPAEWDSADAKRFLAAAAAR